MSEIKTYQSPDWTVIRTERLKALEAVVEGARRVSKDAGYGGWDLQDSYSFLKKKLAILKELE